MTKPKYIAAFILALAYFGALPIFAQSTGPLLIEVSGSNKGRIANPLFVPANSGTGSTQFANGSATQTALAGKQPLNATLSNIASGSGTVDLSGNTLLLPTLAIVPAHGTQAELNSTLLEQYEIGVTTDTLRIYVGSGTSNTLLAGPMGALTGTNGFAAFSGTVPSVITGTSEVLSFDGSSIPGTISYADLRAAMGMEDGSEGYVATAVSADFADGADFANGAALAAAAEAIVSAEMSSGDRALYGAWTGTFGELTISGTLILSGTAAPPSNTATPAAWTGVVISGTTFKIPLYQ